MSGLLLAPLIAIAVLLVIALLLAAQKGRQSQLMGHVVRHHPAHGVPSILFFTGEACAVCHTAQKPALDVLATSIGSMVDIQEIDVAHSPDLARAYRVMTLPTTVVLDAAGRVTQINVGFAPVEKLRAQLANAGVPVPA